MNGEPFGNSSPVKMQKLLCFLLLAMFIAERVTALYALSFRYTDVDHVIMWHAAIDYASDDFYEPYFYGQSYNPMVESLLAAPFVKAGASVIYVMPVITAILAALPFLWLFSIAYRRTQYTVAILIMAFLILHPLEFTMLNQLRGFVPGIAVACLGLIAVKRRTVFGFAIFGFCSALGFAFNPSSLIISFPLGAYLLFDHYRDKRFYLAVIAGALPALAYNYFSQKFYIDNPAYNLHKPWPMEFEPYTVRLALGLQDEFFAMVTPIFTYRGWLLLPLLGLLCVALFIKKKKRESVAVASCGMLIVFALGFKKVHNGDYSLYFSSARMLLGLPYFFVMLFVLLPVSNNLRAAVLATVISAAFFIFKMQGMDEKVDHYAAPSLNKVIEVVPVKTVAAACDEMKSRADRSGAETIIVLEDKMRHECKLAAYSMPAFHPKSAPVIFPSYERRTWLLQEMSAKQYETILFIGGSDSAWNVRLQSNKDISAIGGGFYLMRNNSLPLIEAMKKLGIPVRPF